MKRRHFFKKLSVGTTAVCGAALLPSSARLHAIEPFKRKGAPRFQLSMAAYSFRKYFKYSRGNRNTNVPEDEQIDLFRFMEYCAEQGCAATELTSYFFPPDVDKDYLLKLKHQAFVQGLEISGSAVGNRFTDPKGPRRDEEIRYVKTWIDHCQTMGAPHLRVFAGNADSLPLPEARKLCVEALEECCDYAGQRGVFLGVENHGGIVAEPDGLLDIIQSVQSPWLGVNLDSGNFHTEDPYADFERCAPYAVNVQIKTDIRKKNAGKEQADLGRFIDSLRKVNYQGYVALEYEAAEDPYSAVPKELERLKRLLQ